MAVINSLSTAILITKSSSTKRTRLPAQRHLVFASSDNISINTSTTTTTTTTATTNEITTTINPLKMGSTSSNMLKVFEDKSTGVVCYRDENGEITCEGYDEGPRFCHQLPKSSSKSRDEEIIELLQRNWLHIAGAAE
ncbi:uncharacterized protein LOC132039901 [Lycium ferocissimum]|uniref:uncharacterized protein LOC132039901 n=1 Tax=Lycium ferocissimum TaxID=112874 RepID=UPI002814C4FA|nr:uncharacterized protein LOC132039901 [Lycium ferocissimum]